MKEDKGDCFLISINAKIALRQVLILLVPMGAVLWGVFSSAPNDDFGATEIVGARVLVSSIACFFLYKTWSVLRGIQYPWVVRMGRAGIEIVGIASDKRVSWLAVNSIEIRKAGFPYWSEVNSLLVYYNENDYQAQDRVYLWCSDVSASEIKAKILSFSGNGCEVNVSSGSWLR